MAIKGLIFGFHPVNALLQKAPERLITLYLQEGRHDLRVQEIADSAQTLGITPQVVARKELDKLVEEGKHQGIVARCLQGRTYSEQDILPLLQALNQPAFVLILDEVQDPHNLGACLRTADAAGVHMVIAPKDHSVGLTPAVRKVACGAAETVPFVQVTNLARTLKILKNEGVWLFGADAEAPASLYQTDLSGSIGLVLGAEGEGLRRLTRESCDGLVGIPMYGTVGSLNVSVATGICLFEVVRQRGFVTK